MDLLPPCLEVLAQHFPHSKWEITNRKVTDTAVMDLWPIQVKLVVMKDEYKHFPKDAVVLALSTGSSLIKMYGTPSLAGTRWTNWSCNHAQFAEAVKELHADMMGFAVGVLTVTEGAVEAAVLTGTR
jgi:hypothetical protein